MAGPGLPRLKGLVEPSPSLAARRRTHPQLRLPTALRARLGRSRKTKRLNESNGRRPRSRRADRFTAPVRMRSHPWIGAFLAFHLPDREPLRAKRAPEAHSLWSTRPSEAKEVSGALRVMACRLRGARGLSTGRAQSGPQPTCCGGPGRAGGLGAQRECGALWPPRSRRHAQPGECRSAFEGSQTGGRAGAPRWRGARTRLPTGLRRSHRRDARPPMPLRQDLPLRPLLGSGSRLPLPCQASRRQGQRVMDLRPGRDLRYAASP